MAKKHAELKGDRCKKCKGSGHVLVDADGFYIQATCGECAGTGLVNSPNACTKCKGSGSVIVDMGGLNVEASCDECNGSGLKPLPE